MKFQATAFWPNPFGQPPSQRLGAWSPRVANKTSNGSKFFKADLEGTEVEDRSTKYNLQYYYISYTQHMSGFKDVVHSQPSLMYGSNWDSLMFGRI